MVGSVCANIILRQIHKGKKSAIRMALLYYRKTFSCSLFHLTVKLPLLSEKNKEFQLMNLYMKISGGKKS
jgi:hypothetical protein